MLQSRLPSPKSPVTLSRIKKSHKFLLSISPYFSIQNSKMGDMEVPRMTERGVPPQIQKVWLHMYAKEARLRLKWFRKNEERLVEFAEKPSARTVPAEVYEKTKNDRRDRCQGIERHPRVHMNEPEPGLFDPRLIKNIMKPIDPAVTKLLYSGFIEVFRHIITKSI